MIVPKYFCCCVTRQKQLCCLLFHSQVSLIPSTIYKTPHILLQRSLLPLKQYCYHSFHLHFDPWLWCIVKNSCFKIGLFFYLNMFSKSCLQLKKPLRKKNSIELHKELHNMFINKSFHQNTILSHIYLLTVKVRNICINYNETYLKNHCKYSVCSLDVTKNKHTTTYQNREFNLLYIKLSGISFMLTMKNNKFN